MRPKKLDESKYSIATQLIYGHSSTGNWDYSHHVIPPITASSTFRMGSSERGAEGFLAVGQSTHQSNQSIYLYDRLGEPNNDMLQHALAVAEGAEIAVTYATGMAAIHAAIGSNIKSGEHIIAHKTLYGCTFSLISNWLTRLGIEVDFVDFSEPSNVLKFVRPQTRLIYLESPANPTLEILDLDKISAIIKKINKNRLTDYKILSIIDNTFSTPYCQRPIAFGMDIIVHSLTKGISGFGLDLGGVVLTRREFLEKLILFRKDFGAVLAPHTAWNILVSGLSTLPIRIPRQQQTALTVARFLEKQTGVERVVYPGLKSYPQARLARRLLRDYNGKFAPGFMIYFVLRGKTPQETMRRTRRFMDYIAKNAYCITLAVSLGQIRTLIEHPASMTHSAYPEHDRLTHGIEAGGIRLAIGIEDPQDLIRDLSSALKA